MYEDLQIAPKQERMVLTIRRTVTESSIIAVQIFDQKKFKKKDQGFLGVINIRVGDVLDITLGGDGQFQLHTSNSMK